MSAVIAAALAAPGLALASTTTTVILEFEGDPAAVEIARSHNQLTDAAIESYRQQLSAKQDEVLDRVRASGVNAEVKRLQVNDYAGQPAADLEFRYTMVFNGMAVNVPVNEVHRLREVPGVKAVHRDQVHYTQLVQSVGFVRSTELYGGIAETGPFDDVREGFEGQGINISVIDSGIEWQHEMFGGDPTPPRLGVLADSAAVPVNRKVTYQIPMGDPVFEDGFGHGTHVASTAAGYLGYAWGADNIFGNADDQAIHGVAPQSKLHNYSVCSTVGSASGVAGCLGATIMLALEDSVSNRTLTGFAKPKAHVINMSLGSPNGTPTNATAVAASNAALAGSVVVAAAGNSGSVPGIVGSPSTGVHVISVAATTDPGADVGWNTDVLTPGGRQDIRVFPMAGTPSPGSGISKPFVYVQNGTTVANWPSNVAGKIALVRTGGASGAFAETMNNAVLAGASAVLLIAATENATAVTSSIPGATIKQADADYLLSLLGPNPGQGAQSAFNIRLESGNANFRADVAGFSSRGPVAGFGQVKPDVSAPGVDILAALPPASVLGALSATSDGPMYGAVSGTSMASPHVAGIAAQIIQANPSFGPAEVRTALINAATPMRNASGIPDSHGTHNQDIHSQGGGLVDAFDAAKIKALMGVKGDGINQPRLLGSHSFGNVPSLANQCVSNEGVTAVIRDVRGQGGSYRLSVRNNRGLEVPGVQAQVSPATVNVPAGGEASFNLSLQLDSAAFSGQDLAEFQWYVIAERSDGSETLSMPIYYRGVPSIPAAGTGGVTVESQQFNGVIGPGASQAADVLGTDKTFLDIPVEVGPGGTRLVGRLEADSVTNAAYPDLDMVLLDPNGNQIGSSGNIGSVESIDAAISGGGTYVFRIENYLGVDSSFTLDVETTSQGAGAAPAELAAVQGEYVALNGERIDFDGNFQLSWNGTGAETAFHIERRIDGGAWQRIASLAPSATSHPITGAAEGQHEYRIVSDFPGAICTYTAPPSNLSGLRVDYRDAVTLGQGSVSARVVSAQSSGSEFILDLSLTNTSTTTYLNPAAFEIVSINGDASIKVKNAENGGDGRGTPARFSLVNKIGGESWTAGEATAPTTVRFDNPNGQLFTITLRASAFKDR
nr:S8 family serine peptidase [Lysobacter sp. CAU 1642]